MSTTAPRTSATRVFQVATGNVGREMIRQIPGHTDLELIGVHVYSPEKVGRDVGELAGIDPIGVQATGDLDELIAHGWRYTRKHYERTERAGASPHWNRAPAFLITRYTVSCIAYGIAVCVD